MRDADIFVKTDAGRDEIKSRARGLSMATRAILLMVDGQRNVAALRAVIAGSKAPGDTLEMLAGQGLIEARSTLPVPPPPTAISTPRSATMPRAAERVEATDLGPMANGHDLPAPAWRHADQDGPLDLMLPTIDGPSSEDAPSGASDAGAPQASPAVRYEHLYTMMNEIVRDFLPAHRRYFIQLKIERCGTADELTDLLDTVQAALAKARGDAFANEVVSRLRNAAG